MRRLSLSTKLFAAALPLLLAVGALLALTVRSDLNDVQRAETGADLGAVWQPLITALSAIETEVDSLDGSITITPPAATEPAPPATEPAPPESASPGEPAADGDLVVDGAPAPEPATPADLRRATDLALTELQASVESLGAADAAGVHVTASRSALSAARRALDGTGAAVELAVEVDPIEAYDTALREVVAVGQLLPSEAGDPDLGRELLAVVKLTEAKIAANSVIVNMDQWPNPANDRTPLEQARFAIAELQAVLGEFETIAPEEWATQYRQSGFATAVAGFRADLDRVGRAAATGQIETFDTDGFRGLVAQGVQFQTAISQSIVDRATTEAESTREAALIRIGMILAAVLIASLIAWVIVRSIIRRISAVADGANQVATEQLPALVEALRDPRGKAVLPAIEPVQVKGGDELAELAEAFNSMQDTLVEVAHEQIDVLRRGVSDIFVTMARRNRSLIDRQLAMLDEFEAEVDDPDVLANYYQLDHLSTRMRRNSESLLVLANAEPKRRRVKATEIDDVVRAAIGEVEDYRRIEIEALESLQVRGNVVADVSHLLAELLDNATSFSPPDSLVRVGGRRAGDSYMLRIVDDGVGIPTERMRQLNELLREPPIVGLTASATLGMSVVSLLANKHDISVTLAAGNPGLTVDVVLPSTLFGPIEEPFGGNMPVTRTPTTAPGEPTEQLVAWNDGQQAAVPEVGVPAEAFEPAQPVAGAPPAETVDPMAIEPAPTSPSVAPTGPSMFDDDEPRVVQSDWTKMSLDLSAFKSGQRSADEQAAAEVLAAPAIDPLLGAGPTLDPTVAPSAIEAFEPDTLEPDTFEPIVTEPDTFEPQTFEPVATDSAALEPDTLEPDTLEPDTFDDSVRLTAVVDEETFDDSVRLTAVEEDDGEPIVETEEAETFEPAATDASDIPAPPAVGLDVAGLTLPDLPPPAPTEGRSNGEFAVPPAPPLTADPLNRRPVSPDTARRAPNPIPATPDPGPALPTRSPGTGPSDEPDRLAGHDMDEPSALSAALAAFDNPNGDGSLPTRTRVGDPLETIEEPPSISHARPDPDALRERLRAFQSEFSNGHDSNTNEPHDPNTDLGGDRR